MHLTRQWDETANPLWLHKGILQGFSLSNRADHHTREGVSWLRIVIQQEEGLVSSCSYWNTGDKATQGMHSHYPESWHHGAEAFETHFFRISIWKQKTTPSNDQIIPYRSPVTPPRGTREGYLRESPWVFTIHQIQKHKACRRTKPGHTLVVSQCRGLSVCKWESITHVSWSDLTLSHVFYLWWTPVSWS